MDERQTVRIGIIGVGNMGSAHARCIYGNEIESMRLTALCDTDSQRRAQLSLQFPGVSVFDSYRDLVSSGLVDAVIIATPHKFHAEIGIAAFEAGLHVMTEKPQDISVTAAKRLNEAAKKSGRVFAIMFNQRTNPLFAKARELVKGGELGEPKRLVWLITNWYRTQAYYNSGSWRATWSGEGGGVLLNQAPHNLDLWQWIFGMPSRLWATCKVARHHNIEVEDDATIVADYENGAQAVFVTSTGEYPGTNRLEISGDKGKLVIENGKLCLWRLRQSEREYCFSADSHEAPLEYDYSEVHQTEAEAGHRGVLRSFARAVLFGEPLVATGYEGINELTLSNAAYLSAWTGQPVEIPFDTEQFDRLLSERQQTQLGQKSPEKRDDMGEYKSRWQVKW